MSTVLINANRLLTYAGHSRQGGEGGNGPREGKFTTLGGKVNFGVLSSKLNVIGAKKGAISLFLTKTASFSC